MEAGRPAVLEFRAAVAGGEVAGHVGGEGPAVLLLHGGPMSNYLEPVADELRDDHRVATYQQRGLAPSTTDGPFDVATNVADVVAVLDHLGWDRAVVGGHSWGGYLLLQLVAAHAERVAGALVIDPLGGVGDGGYPAFNAEMERRTPPAEVARAVALDRRMMEGAGTGAEATESLRIFWPAYFADPEHAPAFPDLKVDAASCGATLRSAVDELPALAGRLAGLTVPTVFVHGARSPMPTTASTDTARVLGAVADVVLVEGAGHFPWLEEPGCLRGPLDTLVRASRSAESDLSRSSP